MSWNFKKVGKNKEAMKASVQAENYCPQGLKDFICAAIDDTALVSAGIGILVVESDGHVDKNTGGFGKFSVTVTKEIS